jgi:hypothetical protein
MRQPNDMAETTVNPRTDVDQRRTIAVPRSGIASRHAEQGQPDADNLRSAESRRRVDQGEPPGIDARRATGQE